MENYSKSQNVSMMYALGGKNQWFKLGSNIFNPKLKNFMNLFNHVPEHVLHVVILFLIENY